MKHNKKAIISTLYSNFHIFLSLFVLSIFISIFPGCYYSPTEESISTIIINQNQERSFTKGPDLPDIKFFVVKVTGRGMNPINVQFSPDETHISIEVPSGKDRKVELLMYVDPSSPSAVLTFGGTETVDLEPAEVKNLNIKMGPYETKLVIPDRALMIGSPRLIQINDMSGNGWEELFNIDGMTIRPYDVALDSLGRIYIANDDTTDYYIIRIDNINGENPIFISHPSLSAMKAVAVDRNANLVYFSDGTNLARSNLDGTDAEQLTITGIGTIRGMAVDENGMLYIAGRNDAGSDRVFKYNPDSQTVITANTNTNLSAPWDVLVKGDYIYVANLNGANSYNIMQFNRNLDFIQGFGNNALLIILVISKAHADSLQF